MSADLEPDLEALRSAKAKSGFTGVRVTASRKYQPQIWDKNLGTMRGLGSYRTPEEAARVLAEAKRDGADEEHQGPVDSRAKRGTVRAVVKELTFLPRRAAWRVESFRACTRLQASLDETTRIILEAQERALNAQRIEERAAKRSRVEEAAAPTPAARAAEPPAQAATPRTVPNSLLTRWLARGSAQSAGS